MKVHEHFESAEAAKQAANTLFKDKHYEKAEDVYSTAIEMEPTAILYGNRAFARIRLEQFGGAVADSTKAIELDPTYIKAYYRRADANMAMGKFKEALKDFKAAARVAPSDPDLKRKLLECEKEVKRQRFEEALNMEKDAKSATEQVVLTDIHVEASYTGPRMEGDDRAGFRITREFVMDMVEAFRNQKLVHRRFAYQILLEAQQIFKAQASLVDLEVPEGRHITVCGDTHGQFYDLLNIFQLNGYPSAENPYLFNGDFVDRGSFSVEVIFTLFAFKVLDPACMHLTRGNHETKNMNTIYGFNGEVKAKFGGQMVDVFRETFCWLPIAYCLGSKVLVLHGGLFSREGVTLDDIRAVERNREPPEDGIMCEALWSDPHDGDGYAPSKRGTGVQFGADITKRFLEQNGLKLLVRSHEVKEEGYEVQHDGYCITLFSAPNYVDTMGNKGAYIRFEAPSFEPQISTFTAVPHPNVRPMQYANHMLSYM